MNKKVQEDDLDIFEYIYKIWVNRKIISIFILSFVFIGFIISQSKSTIYASKMNYSVNTLPPFITPVPGATDIYLSKLLDSDFKNEFFTKENFNSWKQQENFKNLSFKDISPTKVLDGYTISKDKNEKLVRFVLERKKTLIFIQTNNLELLSAIFNYANFVNNILKEKYLIRAKNELQIVKTRFQESNDSNDLMMSQLLKIDKFVVDLEEGKRILNISHPVKPKRISVSTELVLLCFAVRIDIWNFIPDFSKIEYSI